MKNSTRCFTPRWIFLTLISWSPSKVSTISFAGARTNFALKNGALGGKLIGAGGGGFLMFVTNKKKFLEKKLRKFNLEKLNFEFDFNGTSAVK